MTPALRGLGPTTNSNLDRALTEDALERRAKALNDDAYYARLDGRNARAKQLNRLADAARRELRRRAER